MNSKRIDFIRRDTTRKILKSKKRLEEKLKISIEAKGRGVEVTGEEVDLFLAEKIFFAVDHDFDIDTALILTDEDYVLEDISIKNETKKKNLERIRGRIIGKEGRTLQVLEELSECYISLQDNYVFIIGPFEKIKDAVNAVKSLIHGSKQANVYSYLEKARAKEPIHTLDLKKDKNEVKEE